MFCLVAATHYYYAILPVYEGDTVDFPSEEKELIFVEYFPYAKHHLCFSTKQSYEVGAFIISHLKMKKQT